MSLHEECGVFGMYDFDGNDVAPTIYYGLFALQQSCNRLVDGKHAQTNPHREGVE